MTQFALTVLAAYGLSITVHLFVDALHRDHKRWEQQ